MSRRRTSAPRPPAPSAASGLDHLVVMRESDEYDGLLMLGMIQQTLTKVRHLPGAVELLSAGMEVFESPERWGAVTKRVARSRMAMVERGGVLYVYSQGSAARDDLEDGNSFVRELTSILAMYQPRETWVASVTRLLRSVNYLSQILESLEAHTETLHGEMEIKVRTPQGRMQFGILALFAASERDYIVQRHTAGRVAQQQRGEWIPSSFPPGYAKQNRRLALIEDEVEKVRQMLHVLADLSLNAGEVTRRLGGIGISSARLRRLHGEDATMADARNPSDAISSLVGWMDLYQNGAYEVLWPNPFAGLEEFAGVGVEDVEGFEHGALRLKVAVPVPEGGWADDETFERIRGRRTLRSPTGGASHDSAPPLSGLFQFVEGDDEFSVAADRGDYVLMRRLHDPERPFIGWQPENAAASDVEVLGRVDRVLWHRSLAEGILTAVESGLPARLDAQRFQPLEGAIPLNPLRADLRARRRELTEVEGAASRALRNARLAEDEELARDFVNEASRHRHEATRLREEIERLEAADEAPSLGETFTSNTEMAAHAIAALADSGVREDATLRRSLRAIISQERWHLDDHTLSWELFVELPHEHGTVVLGPVTGSVEARPARRRASTRRRPSTALRRALIEAGLSERAARSVAACPHSELSSTLLSHLKGLPLGPETDPVWAQHVIAVYCDPDFSWSADKWRLPDETRKPALEALRKRDADLSMSEMLSAGVTESQLRYLRKRTNAPSGDPILVRSGRGDTARYAAIRCPHCGGRALHSVVTPETRPGVMCTTCWRLPVPDSPLFPTWYR